MPNPVVTSHQGLDSDERALTAHKLGDLPDDPLVTECEFVQTDPQTRVYYRPDRPEGDRNGFRFCVLEHVSVSCSRELWDETCDARVLVWGAAYWDGLRHIWWAPHKPCGPGYVYYPGARQVKRVFDALLGLCERFCSEHESPDEDNVIISHAYERK